MTIWENWTYFLSHSKVAFQTDDSWNYNDLPNRNLSDWYWFNSITDNGDSCTLQLVNPVWKTYPAWTKIRMQFSWATFNYIAASSATVPSTWTKYEWEVLWISKFGIDYNYFRRWTKFVKLSIIANHGQDTTSTLYIDDFKLTEVD